jgi:hypothetical protein
MSDRSEDSGGSSTEVGLTTRQTRFVAEYLRCFNATKAKQTGAWTKPELYTARPYRNYRPPLGTKASK